MLSAWPVAESEYNDRISFANWYVGDEELADVAGGPDAIVAPYHGSHATEPLLIALSFELPGAVTRVLGLIGSVEGWVALVLSPFHDRGPFAELSSGRQTA